MHLEVVRDMDFLRITDIGSVVSESIVREIDGKNDMLLKQMEQVMT